MATISIADSDARVQYTQAVTANSTQLTIDFPFFSLDDINVIVTSAAGVDTTLTRGTGTGTFAVNGTSVDDGFSGGNITLGDSYSNASTKFTIFRDIPVTRTTDFPTSGPFNVSSLNTELDRIIAIEQELETKIGRTMKLAESDNAATLSLPNLDTRKGTTLAFNSTTGLPEAGPKIGDVSTIAAITTDIGLLADIQDGTTATNAITTVSGISANVTTVAGISSNVTTVAGNTSNINAVAGDATDIGTVASNISSVNTNATNISAIQGASANATTATTKASEAAVSQAAAASSASSASTSAATATTKASEASTSAGNASTSETNAASSATAAASSATAAAASQTAAAASAASAATAFDNFDDTYLGSKTSNPAQDNDGNPLVSGALYFNSVTNEMRVYDGANWIAASSAGNVSLILYEYTATAGQTTFSGSDDNSATLSYTVDNLQVVMNGIVLDPSDFTAANGTSVVLASGAAAGDLINIYAFKSFTTADMVSKTNGGTFAGAVTVPQLNADNLRLDGNTISTTSGDMTLDAVGDVVIDADGADIRLKHAGTEWGRFVDSTNNFLILNPIADKDIIFNGIDGSSEISALTLDMSDAGKAVFNAGATFGGSVGIGTGSPSSTLTVRAFEDSANGGIRFESADGSENATIDINNSANFRFRQNGNDRMRINNSGSLLVGKTTAGSGQIGFEYEANNGATLITRSQLTCLIINRLHTDGQLVEFRHANAVEGGISVSGSTVSFNGGHLSRWSQATDGNRIDGLVKGTVMTNLDQMAEWTKDGVTEDNEQLNCMAVSSVEGDPNVAGVFVNWDDDDTDFTADMNVAMTGDMVIRIASGTTVARGDLLMSAGDGTAKPQDDDIVRSKTIAKVTSTTVSHTYDDGSYLVPCVLMAC